MAQPNHHAQERPQRQVGYEWRLREVMADRGIYATTELVPLLRMRGVHLSASQVHRMVTGLPERLSLTVLAALCDILTVEPSTLITTSAHTITGRRSATTLTATPTAAPSVPPTPSASEPQQTLRPLRARVTGLDRRNQD